MLTNPDSAYDHCGYIDDVMREIRLRDAMASLPDVVDDAMRGKPSAITRHGKPQVVILSFKDWQRLSDVASYGRLLMSAPGTPEDLSPRDVMPSRIPEFQGGYSWSTPT